MSESWATFGIDLHLDIAGGRVRAGLEGALREAIQTGRLMPGTRLPSSRALALDLGIARNTVADAYGQLVAEGWFVARQGSGTSVAPRAAAAAEPTPSTAAAEAARVGYDLRPGSPNLSAFPRTAWLAATRRALNAAPYDAFGYSDPRGRPELRRALADYLSRARGVRAPADRIVVCSGFTQGLAVLCQVLKARGAVALATEAYGHQRHRDIVAASGLQLSALWVDANGAEVSELGDTDAVLLTPAHQFPLGMPLAASRRSHAVEWAVETGGVVIEDDYDGEFRYDRQPLGAMQAMAAARIVYAGTASKSLAPGLRFGWLVLPAHLVEEVVAAKALADGCCDTIGQLALAEFITSGAYDRHVRRSRLAYRRRRDRLVAALQREAPRVKVSGIAAGLHAVVELSDHEDAEQEVIARAAERGVAVEGLRPYAATARQRGPALVIGYGTPPEHAFTSAIARLSSALALAPPGGGGGITPFRFAQPVAEWSRRSERSRRRS